MHGNKKNNQKEHHLYAIFDRAYRNVYKYGISGRALQEDGSSPRANEQTSLFNRVVGWSRFFSRVLLKGIKGRDKALYKEQEYIKEYQKKHQAKPRGN